MRLRKSVLLLMVVTSMLLVGCAKRTAYRPGTPAHVAQADLEDCKYEAAKYSNPYTQAGHNLGAGISEVFRENKLIEGCMRKKGYYFK